jgi:DNA-3-methyladenine glycosylase II
MNGNPNPFFVLDSSLILHPFEKGSILMAKKKRSPYAEAQEHLASVEPAFKEVIERIGPCTLQVNPDHFEILVRSVISQQISTKAAQSISAKVLTLCGKKGLTYQAIRKAEEEQLRLCGLSTAKRKSIRGLADHVHQNPNFFKDIHKHTDEEVSKKLLPLHGIGPWTVQMFLIFSLGRMDILPVGDLGFRVGIQKLLQWEKAPTLDEMIQRAETWRPYRTIATWYCWRSLGGVPQSD